MIHLISPRKLKKLGILGMNRRNVGYIGQYNRRRNFRIVDDKLMTKTAALDRGIPTPELYGVIEYQFQIAPMVEDLLQRESFVMKPVQGSGGKGILVITGRDGDNFVKSSGVVIDAAALRRHASNIIAGLHSLGGRNDKAMLEALLDFDPLMARYSHEGVPDIRVIVYRGVPVMAMIRCATHASDGKANLHQGAVGVGIDIGSGRPVAAVQHGRLVTEHPDTGARFDDLQIPYWQEILELASSCAEICGLGYLGADIVLDRQQGPMLLELNARPGLSIQVANQEGLIGRLRVADQIADQCDTDAERIAMARERFRVDEMVPLSEQAAAL